MMVPGDGLRVLASGLLLALLGGGCDSGGDGATERLETVDSKEFGGVAQPELERFSETEEEFQQRLGGLAFERPVRGLSAEQLARFNEGFARFARPVTVEEGLGPVFNDVSCGACHFAPPFGDANIRFEVRFGRAAGDEFDPLTDLGGNLLQTRGIGRRGRVVFRGEEVPDEANVVTRRLTTPLFGAGLVEAVPDAALRRIALRQARQAIDGVSGRIHAFTDPQSGEERVGRFGWKAVVPTLEQFSAGAYLNEMGITNPGFPEETCPQGDCALLLADPVEDPEDDGEDIAAFASYMRLLAPPARGRRDGETDEGEAIFEGIGCAICHQPTLRTGESQIAALNRRVFRPYSDFLLHDMGSLGDGVPEGDASATEMRTAPLWGLRVRPRLLHDGRTTDLAEAILAHDGEGRRSRARFAALDDSQRRALIAFLRSL
jgi:CxxC motif-containing protein (DUF1111 family)